MNLHHRLKHPEEKTGQSIGLSTIHHRGDRPGDIKFETDGDKVTSVSGTVGSINRQCRKLNEMSAYKEGAVPSEMLNILAPAESVEEPRTLAGS